MPITPVNTNFRIIKTNIDCPMVFVLTVMQILPVLSDGIVLSLRRSYLYPTGGKDVPVGGRILCAHVGLRENGILCAHVGLRENGILS